MYALLQSKKKKNNLFHLDFSLFHCIIIVINNFFEYGKEI